MKPHIIERNEKIKEIFKVLRESGLSVNESCERLGGTYHLVWNYVREIVYGNYEARQSLKQHEKTSSRKKLLT
jgi:hypothetical protein